MAKANETWTVHPHGPLEQLHLERLATPDLARVVVGHHQVIADHPADALREIARTLR